MEESNALWGAMRNDLSLYSYYNCNRSTDDFHQQNVEGHGVDNVLVRASNSCDADEQID